MIDPTSRGVTDVKHTIAAAGVVQLRSAGVCSSFFGMWVAPAAATAYGSYAELVADPERRRDLKYRDKSFRTGAVLHQKCPFSHNQKPLFT